MKKMVSVSKILIIIFAFSVPLVLINSAITVKGNFYKPAQENSPGVILLHGWIGSGSRWHDLSWRLKNQGYGVHALDLPQGSEYEMVRVVDEGFNYLLENKIDPNRIALIGESTGANLALFYAAKNKKVKTTVLLSPGFRYRLPLSNPESEMRRYGERPILIITSHKDSEYPQSARDSEVLLKYAKGKKELKFASGGHGIGMFDRDVFDWILSWLQDNLSGRLEKSPPSKISEIIPFPTTINIKPPDLDLPKETAAFSGIWEGSWDGVLLSRLVVEKIDRNEAIVIYGWADHPEGGLKGGWIRQKAKVLVEGAIEWGGGDRAKFTFTIDKACKTIKGEREFKGGVSRITMTRKE